jgi:hypothetical protein
MVIMQLKHSTQHNMSARKSKRSLLDIESTIPARLNLNIQFMWWNRGSSALCKGGMPPPLHLLMVHRLGQHVLEEDFRHNLIDKKCAIETPKIKKYVGEFY